MDFSLNAEQRMIQDAVRKFARERILLHSRDWDHEKRFPRELLTEMGALGYLGVPVPEEYGGTGLDYISEAIVFEEIGYADSSVRTTLSVQMSLVELTILKWGSEEQKHAYLPKLCSGEWIGCFGLTEPNAGSDAGNVQTTARREGDSWVINGAKTWISDGTTGELFFEEMRVPDSNRLGEVGQGFKIAMSALDNGRYGVASGCVGAAQLALDASVKYARERIAFSKPIASFQMVQDMLAQMKVDIEAARLLVYQAGWVKNQGQVSTIPVSIAKYFAAEAAKRVADMAIQIHGGYGFSDEYVPERIWRDTRVASLYEGTSQIQKLIIGRDLTGISAFE